MADEATNATDLFWMSQALAEAERGRGFVEPNPLVGAVVVADAQLVGLGHHERYGAAHAEINALHHAGDRARGATLYVTLEPCCHLGKTGPCTTAVLAARISRVVAAMADPFPRVSGQGFQLLREAGIEVTVGVARRQAERLNAPYLKRLATARPYVTAKWAMTLDGKMACGTGASQWISGPRSRSLVHELRGRMDAILVGIGTAITDDPLLTVRPPGPRTPVRVVVDPRGRLPLESKLVVTAGQVPVLVAVDTSAPKDHLEPLIAAGCDVLPIADLKSPAGVGRLLDELGRRGMTNVLLEGGPRLLGAFLDAGEIDAVDAYIAPRIEGGTHHFQPFNGKGVERMDLAPRLEDVEVQIIDGDTRIRGILPRAWRIGPP